MVHMLLAVLLTACVAHSALAQLPGMPMPAMCNGAAQAPVPRSDLNWPANQTRLANELHDMDQARVTSRPCYIVIVITTQAPIGRHLRLIGLAGSLSLPIFTSDVSAFTMMQTTTTDAEEF